nr:MAG TPA: hypothetical protein [Caudoviricetes sp.]
MFILPPPCVRSCGLLWPFMAVCAYALPVAMCATGFSSCLALYHSNMTAFTSGVNIHMGIHFTMVTR